ncbi:MAG: glycosyltransferase [Lachnospiraceae bacterium]|jgi:glycosyltransferase involved in cell wall biosynthesis|nr:glycosyltransferase [Lachnospiraceae bacterium]
MERVNIALYLHSLQKHGTQRVAVNLCTHLIDRGYKVTLVTQYQLSNEFDTPQGVKRIISDIDDEEISNSRVRNFRRRFMKLRRIWQTEKPDVILSFIGFNNIMAILTSRFLSTKVIVAMRCDPDTELPNWRMRFAARFLYRFADRVLLQVDANRDFFPAAVARKAVVVKNPINLRFFRPCYKGEREKTIVSATRLHESKNHQLLIRAFAHITANHPDYQLIIYGEGEERDNLKVLIAKLKLDERVKLAGHVDNLEEVIYRAGIYVLCSNSEGMPNTLVEAMLLGLACVTTDCPGAGQSEIINHGVNGLLIPRNDIDKLVESLEYLITQPEAAERIGHAAHLLQNSYNPLIVYGEWERQILETKGL